MDDDKTDDSMVLCHHSRHTFSYTKNPITVLSALILAWPLALQIALLTRELLVSCMSTNQITTPAPVKPLLMLHINVTADANSIRQRTASSGVGVMQRMFIIAAFQFRLCCFTSYSNKDWNEVN